MKADVFLTTPVQFTLATFCLLILKWSRTAYYHASVVKKHRTCLHLSLPDMQSKVIQKQKNA
jgi:hypothetical protein